MMRVVRRSWARVPPYQDLHAIGACPVRPYSALLTDFTLEVRVTGGAVRTFSGEHHGMSRFPYETLYVALLIAQALAVLAWVMYSPT
jgi:hypothetical protein